MKTKYWIRKTDDLAPLKETLKQKIQPKAQRIIRCEKWTNFYRKSNIFKIDIKQFYTELGKNQVNVEKKPTLDEIENFWENIWGIEKNYKENSEWFKREEKYAKD